MVGAHPSDPRVAVVVATYNRARRLRRMLASLAAQDVPPELFEVIVVDDASTDDTAKVIAGASTSLDVRAIRLAHGRGPAAARDRGWRDSRAPLVAFTDDDCEPAPGWVGAIIAALDPADCAFVQGRTAPNPREAGRLGPFARTLDIPELTLTFNTCNIAYPRALLEQIDGFDVEAFGDRRTAGEDTDLAWRAIAAGADSRFVPGALVWHAVDDLGPRGALRMAARWTPAVRAYARHPHLRRARLLHGVFWKPTHLWLARALLAATLPQRAWPLRLWLALPWIRSLYARSKLARDPALVPFYAAYDLIELAAIARGAVRERTPVL